MITELRILDVGEFTEPLSAAGLQALAAEVRAKGYNFARARICGLKMLIEAKPVELPELKKTKSKLPEGMVRLPCGAIIDPAPERPWLTGHHSKN